MKKYKKYCYNCKNKFRTNVKTSIYCKPGCQLTSSMGKICRHCKNLFIVNKNEYARRIFCSRSCSASNKIGDKALNWQGGKTSESDKIRTSKKYKEWRLAVFKRDNYTCLHCGDNTGGNLEADHIKPRSIFPELTLDINNGRTLCKDCHKKTNTWGTKVFKYRKQLILK